MFNKFPGLVLAAILAAVNPLSALAESFDYRFDVRLGMAKIGEMRVRANSNDAAYATSATLFTTGLAGALYDVRYEYAAEGKIGVRGVLLPVKYRSVSDEQNKITQLEMSYSGDRIASVTFDPAQTVPDAATTHRRTVDPMSLIYFLLRPATPEKTCTGTVDLFDGKKLTKVVFRDVKRSADGKVECDISYSGEDGGGIALSSLVFIPDSNGLMRINSFAVESSIGKLSVRSR